MRETVLQTYQNQYGTAPRYIVRAPGRVNLIGDHTDYQDGFVMPMAVDRAVWVACAPRSDGQIRLHSIDYGGQTVTFSQDRLQDPNLPHWSRYVCGGWWLLGGKGYALPGADIVIGSDVPQGGGMSSSAAIGVAVIEMGFALLEIAKSQVEKALLAVEIEHQFIGMPCGVLDQMASAAALHQSAMVLDCRSLETQPVRVPDDLSVVVMNTMKARELTESGYALRREESEEAARILGVPMLRDATLGMIENAKTALGELRYRRSRHIITENTRVLAMQTALEKNDRVEIRALLNASHTSLRDDYQVSCAELDVMSALAQAHPACFGARMMGGGFGGCAVGLVQNSAVDTLLDAIAPRYQQQTGLQPEFYVCHPAGGSAVEKI